MRLLTIPAVKQAFDLGREPAALRKALRGRRAGQSCLLARRLVEAGAKLVTVCSGFNGETPQDAWDTHTDDFRELKNQLLPPLDRGLSALLDDLTQRGLSERTLLVVMGEFGRTPHRTRRRDAITGTIVIRSCCPAAVCGRASCCGQSDHNGAYPVLGRVCTPADLRHRVVALRHRFEPGDDGPGRPTVAANARHANPRIVLKRAADTIKEQRRFGKQKRAAATRPSGWRH